MRRTIFGGRACILLANGLGLMACGTPGGADGVCCPAAGNGSLAYVDSGFHVAASSNARAMRHHGPGGADAATGDAAADNSEIGISCDPSDSAPIEASVFDESEDSATTDATDTGLDASPCDACPAPPMPCAIMPLGDSITIGAFGGYRVELFRLAHSEGHDITMVGGSVPDGPDTVDGVPFPKNHEGHGGFTIDDGGGRFGLQPIVVDSLATFHPNVVALMIGTNDLDIQLDVENAPTRLARLVDTILDTDPAVFLLVADLVPSQDDLLNVSIRTYNAAVSDLVRDRVDQGRHIGFVDMYGAIVANLHYKTAYYANRLHPNQAGYAVIGGVWYGSLRPLLH